MFEEKSNPEKKSQPGGWFSIPADFGLPQLGGSGASRIFNFLVQI